MNRTRKAFSILLSLCLLLTALAPYAHAEDEPAYAGICGAEGDNLTWVYDPETCALTITGSGDMPLWLNVDEIPWHTVAKQIRSVSLPDGLTSIGNGAFIYCEALAEVTIPETVTYIGEYAFSACTTLSEVEIPDSVTEIDVAAFYYCTSLASVKLSKNLVEITAWAFRDTALTGIDIPAGVTNIDYSAFEGCRELAEVRFPDGLKSIRDYVFLNCSALKDVRFPDGLESIGDRAFCGCISLTEIVIPDSVTTLGPFVFSDCSDLTSVKLSKNLTEIADWAFQASGLTEIDIPEDVTRIGDTAFQKCYDLAEVRLPDGLESIGHHAFWGCRSLTEIVIPDSVTEIGYTAFCYCSGLEKLKLPKDLTVLSEYAFYKIAVTEFEIPASVQVIEGSAISAFRSLPAFKVAEGNENFIEIDGVVYTSDGEALVVYPAGKADESFAVPEGVTAILYSAMESAQFAEVTLPDSLTFIGRDAFNDCHNLKSVTIPDSVTEIGAYAFGYNADPVEGWYYVQADDFVICGSAGSAAQDYAVLYGVVFKDTETGEESRVYPFTDIVYGKYYYEPVLWAVRENITSGKTKETFAPNDVCTRAQAVTFLWRALECPEPSEDAENPFADVQEGSYYYKAVLWAYENGIITGTKKDAFSPDATVTRAQIAVMLWRCFEEMGPDTDTDNPFADVAEGSYYYKAVVWACEYGFATGKTASSFAPNDPCTRAEIVTMLYRAFA